MLKNWTLTITLTDEAEPVTVPVTPRVILDFERHWKQGLVSAMSDDMRLEQLFWLAWKALHRSGRTVSVFEEWTETLVDVELNVEAAHPLGETASAT